MSPMSARCIVQENEQQTHMIPPILSGGVLAVGVVLLAGGLMKSQ